MKRIDYEREIFALLFKTSNGLQVYLDRILLSDRLTAKQMFLMIVIHTFGEHQPTLKEVADRSSSSYQNVKQLALKLEKEGFVEIQQNEKDRRKKQLVLTKQAVRYWDDRELKDLHDMGRLFEGCNIEELKVFWQVIHKLQLNIAKM